MAKNAISRKLLHKINHTAFVENVPVTALFDRFDVTAEDYAAASEAEQAADNRPHKAKPSAETLKNAAIKNEIVTELETRGGEFTAKQLAELMTDPEGMPMGARKVGVLLGHLAREGRIAKSSEAWSSPHYGKLGTEFEKKPVKQRRKSEQPTD